MRTHLLLYILLARITDAAKILVVGRTVVAVGIQRLLQHGLATQLLLPPLLSSAQKDVNTCSQIRPFPVDEDPIQTHNP